MGFPRYCHIQFSLNLGFTDTANVSKSITRLRGKFRYLPDKEFRFSFLFNEGPYLHPAFWNPEGRVHGVWSLRDPTFWIKNPEGGTSLLAVCKLQTSQHIAMSWTCYVLLRSGAALNDCNDYFLFSLSKCFYIFTCVSSSITVPVLMPSGLL